MSDEIQMMPVPDCSQITATGQEIIRKVADAMGISYEMLSAEYVAVETSWAREVMETHMEMWSKLGVLNPRVNAD